MIIDCLHTENTEGNGDPQADFWGNSNYQKLDSN